MLVEHKTLWALGHSPVFKLLSGCLVCCVCWVSISHEVHPETNSSHDSLGTGHTSKIRKSPKRKNCPVYLCDYHFICPKIVWFLWVQTRERTFLLIVCATKYQWELFPALCSAVIGKTWRKHEFKNYSDISETFWQYLTFDKTLIIPLLYLRTLLHSTIPL